MKKLLTILVVPVLLLSMAGCSQKIAPSNAKTEAVASPEKTLTAFQTTVSTAYVTPYVQMILANSNMDTSWFVQRAGGRTIYSTDVYVGRLVHGAGSINAHATWVINYDPTTRTVNLNKNKTHITNWWGAQRCHVYEDGTCNCGTNPNWTICGALPNYVKALHAAAIAARINAVHALTQAGYTVTNN